jgi:hypothetical protein
VVLVDEVAENVSPTEVSGASSRWLVEERHVRESQIRARDGEDEAADAYSRELVSADPEGFIYSDPAPDMRFPGVRGLACRSATQVGILALARSPSSRTKRSGLFLPAAAPWTGVAALARRQGATSQLGRCRSRAELEFLYPSR